MVYIKIIKNKPPDKKQYSIVGAAVVEKYQRPLLYHGIKVDWRERPV